MADVPVPCKSKGCVLFTLVLLTARNVLTLLFVLAIVLILLHHNAFPDSSNDNRLRLSNSSVVTVNQSVRKNVQPGLAVVCIIFTTPVTWSTRGHAVRSTWAPRCPFHVFFYSKSAARAGHDILNASDAVPLDVPEGRAHLTNKTWTALRYSFERFGNTVAWYLKADDDTYVIWENLEYFIAQPERRIHPYYYIGQRLTHLFPHFNSGGAGYLISTAAVRLLLTERKQHPKECGEDGGASDDYVIGRCLLKLGIAPSYTADSLGRMRFHPDNPLKVLQRDPNSKINITSYSVGCKQCDEMLSGQSISFHYVTPAQMLMFDFLLYQLHRLPTSNNTVAIT